MNQKKVKIKMKCGKVIDGFLLTWNISGVTELRDKCGNKIYGEIV